MKQPTTNLIFRSLVFLAVLTGLQSHVKAQGIVILKRPEVFTDFMSNDDEQRLYGVSQNPGKNLEDLPSSGKPWNIWCVEGRAPLFATTDAQRILGNLRFKEKLQVTKTELKGTGNGTFEHWLQVVRGVTPSAGPRPVAPPANPAPPAADADPRDPDRGGRARAPSQQPRQQGGQGPPGGRKGGPGRKGDGKGK